MLRMQVPVGTRLALPVGAQDPSGKLALTTVEAGGMVHHKVADAQWTGLPTIGPGRRQNSSPPRASQAIVPR